MPRKSKYDLDREVDRGLFPAYLEMARAMNETNDCTVRAVAAACGVTYQEAHAAMARHGRKPRSAASTHTMRMACKDFGFETVRGCVETEVALLAAHKNYHVKRLTTRQVAMFADHFGKTRNWNRISGVFLMTNGHVAAYAKGKVHDFGAARALRVYAIYFVRKAT